ncbi:MAG TPA: MATE family efflux transporter [Kofleriaceae bacterium]|nr:MATE family efflux transporter [Kofleriaceae bacterium]
MAAAPAPLRTLLRLSAPMVLARACQSVLTFADAIQVRHLGVKAIAATATGGMNVLGFIVLAWGTVFIIQSFVSQLTGRGDRDQAPRFVWYGLAIALVAAVISMALTPWLRPALALTHYSPEVQAQMADYMTIRMTSIFAVVGMEVLGNWYSGLGNTWMQMVSGVVTMVAAVFFNWVLIDGHLGAPAMGVNGAALATSISSFLGFAVIAVAFWRRWGGAPKARTAGMSVRELGRVLRFGLPYGFNWFLEFTAFQLFINIVLSNLGDTTVAALNVVTAVNSMSFMPAFGLASAGAILVGQTIGRGARDAVWPVVRLTLACAMTWMGAIGVIYAVFPAHVIAMFATEHAGNFVAVGVTMLLISAAWQLADAVGITLSEALRAAGDTIWIATARVLLVWLAFTPAAFLTVLKLDGGPVGAMLCLVGYDVLLAIALAWRFRSGKWKRIELIEPALV